MLGICCHVVDTVAVFHVLYMYVYTLYMMDVCIYVCMYIRMYVCIYTVHDVHVRMYVCTLYVY